MTAVAARLLRALDHRPPAIVQPLAIIAAFAILLLISVVPSAAAPTHPTSTASNLTLDVTADAPTVSLVSMSPEILRVGDDLTVVAKLTNSSTTTIAEPVATLSLSRVRYATRSALSAWAELTSTDALGSVLASTAVPEPLAPGASTTVTFTVNASAINLTTGIDGWGPRGVSVSVNDATTPSTGPLAVLRTYLLWFPIEDSAVLPLDVAVAVPIVGPALDPLDPGASAAAFEETTTKGGRLTSVLAATETASSVTWVVDPALVTTTPKSVVSESTSSGAASSWAQRTLAAAATHEVYALPEYDLDLAALTAVGAALPTRQPLLDPLTTWRTDLAWPETTGFDLATAKAAAATGSPVVIAPPGALAPDPELTYTPSGTTVLPTDIGPITALLPDTSLSNQLATPTDASPAAARQRLLAESAIISREHPADARQLLLTTPRNWFPDPEMAQAQLSVLTTAPWVRPVPVSALNATADSEVPRISPEVEIEPTEYISPAMLNSLHEATETIQTVAEVVPDPSVYKLPADAAAQAATSVAWRTDEAGRTAAVTNLTNWATTLRGQVKIAPGSDFTLISAGSSLPLIVANGLEQPVVVLVSLVPDDPRLIAVKPVTTEVPAGGQTEVHIPVRAVGSGDVTVTAVLSTADGKSISPPSTFKVRVRADWENRGTAVVAIVLVILLGAGIYRTIHRGRSNRRATGAEVALLEQTEARERGEVTGSVPAAPAPGPTINPPESAVPPPDQLHGPKVTR